MVVELVVVGDVEVGEVDVDDVIVGGGVDDLVGYGGVVYWSELVLGQFLVFGECGCFVWVGVVGDWGVGGF